MVEKGAAVKDKDRLSVLLPKDLKARMKNVARKERRKLSDWVRIQLEDAVKRVESI